MVAHRIVDNVRDSHVNNKYQCKWCDEVIQGGKTVVNDHKKHCSAKLIADMEKEHLRSLAARTTCVYCKGPADHKPENCENKLMFLMNLYLSGNLSDDLKAVVSRLLKECQDELARARALGAGALGAGASGAGAGASSGGGQDELAGAGGGGEGGQDELAGAGGGGEGGGGAGADA